MFFLGMEEWKSKKFQDGRGEEKILEVKGKRKGIFKGMKEQGILMMKM